MGIMPPPLFLTLGIGAVLLVLGLIILLVLKRLHTSPNRAMAYMAGRTVPHPVAKPDKAPPKPQNNENKELFAALAAAQRRGSSPPKDQPRNIPSPDYRETIMLNLFVEDQNTAIGRRNIHAMKSGAVLTIGGGNSDFLIFLVSLPPHLAELRFDGRQCSFIPKRPRFFPDIGGRVLPDCLGKTIRLVSERNYELFFRIEQYENPLDRLNRLLRSLNTPGVSVAKSIPQDTPAEGR
jgi:Na+-transporting methylmalonyl-CoA/oxaloacetate decarboxylase gamma subunit